MNKGIEVTGSQPRELTLDGEHIISGGNGTDGIRCVGKELMLDGKVIAESAKIPKVGPYIKNSDIVYGSDYLKDYPQGLTTLFNNTIHWYSGYDYPSTFPISTGAKQGAAIYSGKWYQFYAGGHVEVYEIRRGINTLSFDLPNVWPDSNAYHCSSASFSNEFENEGDALPLCYVSNAGYVCVFNLNYPVHLVRWFYIEHNYPYIATLPAHGGWAVYDFATNRGWECGYPQGVNTGGVNHANAGVYEIIPFTFPQSGSGEITSNVVIDYANRIRIEKADVVYLNDPEPASDDSLGDRDWSNIQDGDYKDGHIFILNGGTGGRADRPKILDYNIVTGEASMMYTNIYGVSEGIKSGVEAEGIACFHDGWLISGLYTSEKIFVL